MQARHFQHVANVLKEGCKTNAELRRWLLFFGTYFKRLNPRFKIELFAKAVEYKGNIKTLESELLLKVDNHG